MTLELGPYKMCGHIKMRPHCLNISVHHSASLTESWRLAFDLRVKMYYDFICLAFSLRNMYIKYNGLSSRIRGFYTWVYWVNQGVRNTSNSHFSKSRNLTEEVKWFQEQKWHEWKILEKWQTEKRSFEEHSREEIYQRIALSRSFLCHIEHHCSKHTEACMALGTEVRTWNQWMRLSFFLIVHQAPERVHTDSWEG